MYFCMSIFFHLTNTVSVKLKRKMIVLLQTNSFQLVITTNGNEHFIILNYGKLFHSDRGTVSPTLYNV